MIGIKELKKHYLFSEDDEKNLQEISKIVLPFLDEFARHFYNYLMSYPESAEFFRAPEASKKRKETIKRWLRDLLEGPYDNRYLSHLEHIGRVHVKRGIQIHWVTASMNIKREYLLDILEKEVRDTANLKKLETSLNKILDMNLDVLASSYHEEEIKQKFLSARMDSVLVAFADRFTYGLNIILVLALIGLSLGIIGLFASEIFSLVSGEVDFGETVLSAVGTLLIVWVMIELMRAEINYLKGESFHIEIFVSVALVASIRELLIATLAETSATKLSLILAAILVLGVVYFLILRTEAKR